MSIMLGEATRNFGDYYLGDNVYRLAQGVVPEIGMRLGMDLPVSPRSEDLGRLVGAIGKNKVLRDNAELTAIDQAEAVELVEQSGVQKPLMRSLWTPSKMNKFQVMDATIISGGMANWQDRTANVLLNDGDRLARTPVYIAVGSRVMQSVTERVNPRVMRFTDKYGSAPTESQYAEEYIAPRLSIESPRVDVLAYETESGDEIAARFVADKPELFVPGNPWDEFELPTMTRLNFARVANAGIQLAVQFRKAARLQDSEFDNSPDRSQVFIQTDTFPLARTPEQLADAAHFQSPFNALRQVAITARMLHEAAGGE